jgi:hypothetical protein
VRSESLFQSEHFPFFAAEPDGPDEIEEALFKSIPIVS